MALNIFEALRVDHDKQRELIEKLVETQGDTEVRRKVFKTLKEQLKSHAIAEEKHFYAHLMAIDNTVEKARHSVAEHKEIDDLIEKLVEQEFSSTGWLSHAKNLEEKLTHHLDEEEQEVFKSAGHALSEKAKLELATSYQKEMSKRLD